MSLIPASDFLTPVIVAHAINTTDLGNPNPQPPITLTITTPSLPSGVSGVAYSTPMQAIGGIKPYFWSNPYYGEGQGHLPSGLTIDPSTGVISGTPTNAGTYTVQIRVGDSSPPEGHFAYRRYTLTIAQNPMSITSIPPPDGTQSVPYTASLTSSGGTAPVHWTVVSGSLPNGLALSDTGTISGTPTTLGGFTFTVKAADSANPQHSVTATYTITIYPQGPG